MKELLISLDNSSPKYKQIYQSIRSLIENGECKPHTKLPSIRQLAEVLEVSRNTTLLAYEQLSAEGYIRSEEKRGYFVEKFEPIHIQTVAHEKAASTSEISKPIIDFRAGAVDQQTFPLKTWRKCSNDVLNEGITYVYGDFQGDPLLREQLASYLLQSRGIRTSPESIVIGSSSQQLLTQLTFLLRENYSSIAVENPGYDGAKTIFSMQGFTIHPIPVSEKGISIKQLKECGGNLVYITPSHQFPMGMTIPIPERQQLLRWAHEQEGYIIEDDYDSEFRYKQQPIPALSSLQPNGPVIYIGTFSKAFLPSIRLGYMILPPKLLKQYQQQFASIEQTASSIHQRTMARFMELGHWDSHIRKMRTTYKQKMHVLVTAIQQAFGKKIHIIGSQSGLYIILRLKTSSSEQKLIQQASLHGVKVYPTSHYYVKNVRQDEVLLQLGFSNLSPEQIYSGVQHLKMAWPEFLSIKNEA